LANRLPSGTYYKDSDIILEYRKANHPLQAVQLISDGSVIDLNTLICYSSLDEWFNAINNNKDSHDNFY
jgi:hypothetical protein